MELNDEIDFKPQYPRKHSICMIEWIRFILDWRRNWSFWILIFIVMSTIYIWWVYVIPNMTFQYHGEGTEDFDRYIMNPIAAIIVLGIMLLFILIPFASIDMIMRTNK